MHRETRTALNLKTLFVTANLRIDFNQTFTGYANVTVYIIYVQRSYMISNVIHKYWRRCIDLKVLLVDNNTTLTLCGVCLNN